MKRVYVCEITPGRVLYTVESNFTEDNVRNSPEHFTRLNEDLYWNKGNNHLYYIEG